MRIQIEDSQDQLQIRPETPADHDDIRAIHLAAFGRHDEAEAVDTLRQHSQFTTSLVAELDGQVVGHVLFTPAHPESHPDPVHCAGLGPLAIHPGQQGRGIGSTLVREGLARCRKHGQHVAIALGAAEFFQRFGFRPATDTRLTWDGETENDPLMVLELVPGALAEVSGAVRFTEGFRSRS